MNGGDERDPPRGERLQKVLARAGVGSRRSVEELIVDGRVSVDGRTIRELGTRVDPLRAKLEVDGRRVRLPERFDYWLLNKPRGFMTTMSDPEGRPTVADVIQRIPRRVVPVGRLDFNSEGLLLLTNDGETAQRVAHPRYGLEKIYRVKVHGVPSEEALTQLRNGVFLGPGERSGPARVAIVSRTHNAWLQLVVHEGKKHLIRRMLQAVGHPVNRLRRIGLGPLRLGRLKAGEYRQLTPEELEALMRATGRGKEPDPSGGTGRGRPHPGQEVASAERTARRGRGRGRSRRLKIKS